MAGAIQEHRSEQSTRHSAAVTTWWLLASFPGPSQILSRSSGEKSGEGLGSKLRHGPEMVDSVSTKRVHVTYWQSLPFPVCDVILIPNILLIFLHGWELKSEDKARWLQHSQPLPPLQRAWLVGQHAYLVLYAQIELILLFAVFLVQRTVSQNGPGLYQSITLCLLVR